MFEAVQPLKLTPLQDWIKRGKDEHFMAKRPFNSGAFLSPRVLQQMRSVGERVSGEVHDFANAGLYRRALLLPPHPRAVSSNSA